MIDPTIVSLERQFQDFNTTCNIAVGHANMMHLRKSPQSAYLFNVEFWPKMAVSVQKIFPRLLDTEGNHATYEKPFYPALYMPYKFTSNAATLPIDRCYPTPWRRPTRSWVSSGFSWARDSKTRPMASGTLTVSGGSNHAAFSDMKWPSHYTWLINYYLCNILT